MAREHALQGVERISAVNHAVSSLEYLLRPQDRRRGGFDHWPTTRRIAHAASPRLGPALDVIGREAVTVGLHAARVGASVALLAPTGRRTRMAANAALTGTTSLLYPRHRYGTDGTDQVGFLVQTAALSARATRDPRVADAALWYIALQASLSYTVSGWVKLAGASWRTGTAIPGVTRTRTYGDERTWRLLERFPRTGRLLGASVLGMECLFPVVYGFRGRLAPAWLAGVAGFHLGNARIMGLGRFVWAFGSMHPALRYVTAPRELPDGGRRDDTLPRVVGGAAVALAAGGLAAQARRRGIVLAGRGDEELVATQNGNRVAIRVLGDGAGADERPPIVLDAAMLCSGDHWHHVSERLARRSATVEYSRAGYARSVHDGATPYSLQVAVEDLLDVTERAAGERPVVLVGHSLGGWIAMRAAAQAPERVAGLVLLDSSHPDELRRSSKQAQGQQVLTQNLSLVAPSLALGFGPLLERPEWLEAQPEELQRLLLAQHRDGRMWSAGLREWRAAVADFGAYRGRVPEVQCPMLCITAGATALEDPIQLELHREMAQASPDGRHEVVDGLTHDGIVFDPRQAAHVAARVQRFADEVAGAAPRFSPDPTSIPTTTR